MAPKRKLEEAEEADESIQDIISKILEVRITTSIDPEDHQVRVMAALEGLRPGIGVIGTREQEEQLAKDIVLKAKSKPQCAGIMDVDIQQDSSIHMTAAVDEKDNEMENVRSMLEYPSKEDESDCVIEAVGSINHNGPVGDPENVDLDGQVRAISEGTPGSKNDKEVTDQIMDDTGDEVGCSAIEYKPKQNKKSGIDPADNEEAEALGDYEKLTYGHDYVELDDESMVDIWTYFDGKGWRDQCERLYAVEPIPIPPDMAIIPHDYQLKGAAQVHELCDSPFRGILIGHAMGVGKTMIAILAMWLRRGEPGMSLVICPASLCEQWVETIEHAWKDGKGLRAFHLHDSWISAMQLLASGVDVIVCSYQFAESNGRELSALQAKVEEYCNDPNGKTPQPSRPTSALHSPFWETTEHMWKLVVLDEAQLVNKREKIRHKAIKKGIPAKAYIIMSGTLAHNKWHNMSGYVDFLQGHPFTTHTKFLHTFSSFSTTGNIQAPHISRIRLLQRFLQAFLIAVPASVLNLQNVVRNRVEFPLTPADKQKVDALTLEYRIASQAGATDTVEFGNAGQEQDTGNALSFAVMAQLAASHPLILRATMENRIKARGTIDRESGEVQISVQEDLGGAQRDEWLKKVKESTNLIEESGRVTWFIKLFKWLRGKYPDEKIVVFSTYLKFLDILAEALRRAYNIVAVRYDGSVLPSKRTNVERVFQLCSPEIPLLITAGAGGIGLNIQHASIVIQTEPWWNSSVELQAVARCHRQNQTKQVKHLLLMAPNSEIDKEVLCVRIRKTCINASLMQPLIKRHDEPIQFMDLLTYPALPIQTYKEYNQQDISNSDE